MKVKTVLVQLLVLVVLLTSFPVYPTAADISSTQLYLVKFRNPEMGVLRIENRIEHRYEYLPIVTARLTETERLELEADDNVEYIEEDYSVLATEISAFPEFQPHATEPPVMMSSDILVSNKSLSSVRVAILDTGSWQGLQVNDGVSFVKEGKNYHDNHGHGTYITSILQREAPNAAIYALKVLNDQGIGTYSAVIKALEWSIANEMDIVNMSFGGQEYSLALAEAVTLASEHGLMLVAAAGNDGHNMLNYPARFNHVVAVGSVDQSHVKSAFSNTGNELDFVAVGENVAGIGRNGKAIQGSGTSASVPQVTAIAALYMESFPSLHKDEIRELLRNTALPLGIAEQYGYGLAQYLVSNEEEQKEESNDVEEGVENKEIEGIIEIEETVYEEQDFEQSEANSEGENLVLLGKLRLQNERERLQSERLLTAERQQLEQEMAKVTVQDVAQEFQVDEEWIHDYLATGYTLQEIIFALRSQQSEVSNRLSISSARNVEFPVRKETVNISLDAEPEVISNIGDHIQPEEGKYPLIKDEEQVQLWEGTPPIEEENLETELFAMNSLSSEEPVIAPVEKSSEAPYTIGLHGEDVSMLSGSLSLSSTDLALPGRNGLSFALTRRYNSSDSQFEQPNVSTSSTYVYGFSASLTAETRNERYNLTRSYSATLRKYVCSSGQLLWSEGATGKSVSGGTYTTMSSLDTARANPPGLPSETVHACNTVENDRTYVKVYTFSSNSYSTSYTSWSGSTYSMSFGPYSTYTDAQNTRNSIASGQSNSQGSGGSYSGGYYQYRNTYSNVGSVQSYLSSYSQYNSTTPDPMEKKFPIGKGWSWNIPYVKTENGKRYVSLPDGSVYEVSGTTLKNYRWSDLSFTTDTTVSYSGRTSSHALKSTFGTNYYFDSVGNLIQIKDNYGNTISFGYTNVSPYGLVLTSIKDAANNTINIQYSASQVILTLGNKTVTYAKTTTNGKELLSQVIDPMGRVTTYQYEVKTAKFNLLGSTPSYTNPFALITGVVHPTGVTSKYTYEVNPVRRFIGSNQVNQFYRLAERKDVVTYSDQTTEEFNRSTLVYSNDMGSSYNTDMTFHTTLFDGLLETKMVYAKDYVNSTIGTVYYNTQIVQSDGEIEQITNMSYDQQKYRTNPISSTTYYNNIATAATSTPVTTSQVYDDYQNVVSSTSPLGVTAQYTYDTNTRRLTISNVPTDAGQSLFTEVVSRNAAGDITELRLRDSGSSGAVLSHVQYQYDTYGNIILIRNKEAARDLLTQITYSSSYQYAYPTQISRPYTDADGQQYTQTVQATYDQNTGLMLSYTDANQHTTTYAYDSLGRLTQVTNPDQTSIAITIFDTLNEVEETNEAGQIAYSRWNPLGWSTESGIEVGGVRRAMSKSGYDSWGRAIWNEDIFGNRSVAAYDDWGRSTSVTSPNQSQSITSYNDFLRTVTATDAEGNSLRQSMDILGRVVQSETLRNGSYVTQSTNNYNYAGQLISQLDSQNYLTKYTYTPLGQIRSVTAADGSVHAYAYDRSGNLLSMTYPDQSVATKAYDELGRLIRAIDPLQQSEVFYYDAAGNRTKLVDKKQQQFLYTYNSRNMLLSKQGPDETISFTYELDGKRATMTDNGGSLTSYNYDSGTGQLTGITYPDGNTIAYSYDSGGRRTGMQTPFADEVAYSYNNVNRLTEVDWNGITQASYTYDAIGRPSQQLQANGISTEHQYTDGFLTRLVHKNNAGVLNLYDYEYDSSGNITTRSETVGSATETHQFTYDSMHRSSTSTLYDETYAYDLRGNRKTLESDSSSIFDGIMNQYEYDAWDRLIKVTNEDGLVVEFKYNGDNLLTERKVGSEITRYYYDGAHIIAEANVDGNGNISEIASYLYGAGLIMRDGAAEDRGYYLKNGHGDIVEIRGSNQGILNQYQYDLWGNTIYSNEQIENPFRYSGEYWDDTIKLQYLRARWYQPSLGRFINEDTYEGELNNPLSLNLYAYVHNNPIRYVDPSGNMPVARELPKIIRGIQALIVGGSALVAGNIISVTQADQKAKDFTIPVPITVSEARNNKNKNEKITLYHATSGDHAKNILDKGIDIFAGRTSLDFGEGFYLTNNIQQAEKWIQNQFQGQGTIMIFQVDEEVFSGYKGKSFKGKTRAWKDYVFNNRNGFKSQLEHYDYVEGPYLANPHDKASKSSYVAKGYQLAIKNVDLASEIFKGYIGSFVINK